MVGTVLREVSILNNEAVRLLASGHCLSAMRTFQHGVSALKVYSTLSDDQPSSAEHERFHTATSAVPNAYLQARQIKGLKNSPSFVFSRPLSLTVSDHENQEGEFAIISSSSILLFNLGLTCHMLSVQNNHAVSMSQVLKCYNLALSVLCRIPLSNATDKHDVLKCLILNNLAQIHYEECDYQGSQYYMQRMHTLARTGCLTRPPASLYISKNDSDEIMLNLLFLHKPTSARAA